MSIGTIVYNPHVRSAFWLSIVLLLVLGCAPSPKRVTLVVDGQRRAVDTRAATVDAVLQEQRVTLGPNDRVEPPTYAPLDRNTTVTIVRVEVKTETATQTLPFERQIVHDETSPEGSTRMLQLGANGQARVTYQLILEDGTLTARREISRTVLSAPSAEVLAVGTQGALPAMPVRGTLLYLANGNAWVMRNRSDDKRPLTTSGDLDGRVFDLSPNGELAMFSRADKLGRLNSLWYVNTVILEERPQPLPVQDALYAQWAREPGVRAIAYSTGEKTPNVPGWKAHNDLYIATVLRGSEGQAITASDVQVREIISASNPALYSWWGAQFDWAPDGRVVGYALADQVGLVDVESGVRRILKSFAYYRTRADWVWTPAVSWSPDSRYLAAALHMPPEGVGALEDSPVFDAGVLARDNSLRVSLARNVGMWAAPSWSPANAQGESKIAFGQAVNTADTERSLYALMVMDRDGSNRQQIFPNRGATAEGLDLIRVAWSPDGAQLAAIRDGDVWVYDLATSKWTQITANGNTKWVRWK